MTAYSRRLMAFLGAVEGFAHKVGSSYVLANSGSSFEDLILKKFRAMGLAR
jgi:hypothetical protein